MQKTPIYRSSRTALMLVAVASSLPATVSVTLAGEGSSSLSSLAQREMIRRQGAISQGDIFLEEGRAAYAKGDYQMAVDKYSQALGLIPDSPMVSDRRQTYIEHLSDASVALAMQDRKVGKYSEARALLEHVLAVDPNNAAAKRELGYLDDPIRTNPALTYEHTQNVDKVRRALYTAEGNYNLGKYDDAKREYDKVLRLDSYNSAARRGLEKIATTKSDYYRAAYDQTRAELLGQVDAAWELSVPADAPQIEQLNSTAGNTNAGTAYINSKLQNIKLPRIQFDGSTVAAAIDFLRLRATEFDTTEREQSKKGINFVVSPAASAPVVPMVPVNPSDVGVAPSAGDAPLVNNDLGQTRITLNLRDVSLADALGFICDQAKLRWKVDNNAVSILPLTEGGDALFEQTFQVPPGFKASLDTIETDPNAATANPFEEKKSGGGLAVSKPILTLLAAQGITFGPGTSASLSPNGVLRVTQTASGIASVAALVASNGSAPKQVKITTKFVEITQNNNEELGFDWVVSPFSLTNNVFGSGGTSGNQPNRTGNDFTGPIIPGVPLLGKNNVTNIVTGGNRSGDTSITRNNIDAILNNPNRTAQVANVAPGIMGLTGLFSEGEVKVMMRGLSQKKGVDLMTAPSVVAQSGKKAQIDIIRSFIYPIAYTPPQIPTTVGTTTGSSSLLPGLGGGGSSGSFPVTPATPSAWDTRNTGVSLPIQPVIGADNYNIDLNLNPSIVEFEGFINYGSPIQTAGTDAVGNSVVTVLTENRIEMPIFSTRSVSTNLSIYDGYTVSIGGLMREDVQITEDKVPILGDIPIIGRLFQSSGETRVKSNIIIFVTAQIIDPTGRPLRGVDSVQAVQISGGGAVGSGSTPSMSADPGSGVLPTL